MTGGKPINELNLRSGSFYSYFDNALLILVNTCTVINIFGKK